MSNFLRRAGWMFLTLLFVVTALGVGIFTFWQATHQNKNNNGSSQQNCPFNSVSNVPAEPAPEPFKPGSDITQLSSTDLQTGSGDPAKAGDCLTVKYYGTLASDGTKFDEDFTTPQALKFQLGASEVIPGWDQGLVGMKSGGTRRLVIPSDLAYGDQGVCQTPNQQDQSKCDAYSIKPNADLVFVVKLINISKR